MVKSDVIKTLAKREKLRADDAQRIVESLFGIIEDGLKQDGTVMLSGFGTLSVRVRHTRRGYNFQKCISTMTNQTLGVHFKASHKLVNRLLQFCEEKQGEGDS